VKALVMAENAKSPQHGIEAAVDAEQLFIDALIQSRTSLRLRGTD
jgi:hypothetical protein